jgi:hypothetical protein
MEAIKANLDGTPVIDNDSVYLVDFSKMQSIQELVLLLAAVGFSFSPLHPQFENIKHLLNLDNPIKIGNPQSVAKEQSKELKLPKLKSLK